MCGIAGELRFYSQPSEADWKIISELWPTEGRMILAPGMTHTATSSFAAYPFLTSPLPGINPWFLLMADTFMFSTARFTTLSSYAKYHEQRGTKFRSNSDSEVVLYSLIEWGHNALDRFNGMFALGFYDTHERKLLLARDHAGIKPLYFLNHSKGLMFASQYDQLLAHPWSKNLPFSAESAALYLHLAFIPAPYAILKNTSMLEPGSWLEIDSDRRIRQGCYYEFPSHQTPKLRGQESSGMLWMQPLLLQ